MRALWVVDIPAMRRQVCVFPGYPSRILSYELRILSYELGVFADTV